MDADLVGYVLNSLAFQIESLQLLPIGQCHVSVSTHDLTSFSWSLAVLGHFVKSVFSGVFLSTGFHALRLASFVWAALTVSAFTLKAANLLNDMEPFMALLLSTASRFSP
jgi:hypothetical protein